MHDESTFNAIHRESLSTLHALPQLTSAPVSASQIFMKMLLDQLMTRVPSEEKQTDFTMFEWPVTRHSGFTRRRLCSTSVQMQLPLPV